MAAEILSVRRGAYLIALDDDGSTRIQHSSMEGREAVRFFAPRFRLSIAGERVMDRVEWGVYAGEENPQFPITMECNVAGLRVRVGLGFHLIHGVPTRTISVRNNRDTAVSGVELELWLPMPADSGYAILSSSDKIAFTREDNGPGVLMVSTLPVPVQFQQSKKDRIAMALANAVILSKTDGGFGRSPEEDGGLPDRPKGSVIVDGSPAYLVADASIEPGHTLSIQVPHFWLRTARDTGGFSGIGFVVLESDWEGALACVSAPTRLSDHQGSVIDHLLGLYSPIEFCRSATEASLRRAIDRLVRETNAAIVYVLLPADFDPAQVRGLHEALKAASTSVSVITVGPQPRDILPIVLWQAVADLLSASTLLGATLPKRLAVVSPAIDPSALTAATERGQVICLSEDPDLVAELIEQLAFTEVCLPATGADLRDAILQSATERGLDLGPVNFEIDKQPSTRMLSGLAARQAAQRCVANALTSLLQVNNVGLLDLLFEQLCESISLVDAGLAEQAREKAKERDVRFLSQVARLFPDLAVRSAVYASCGPAALVVGVVSRQRWQDAVIAAQFGNAKALPVLFLSVDDDHLAALGLLLDKIEESIITGDESRTREYLKQIGMDWVTEAAQFHLLRLARKSIVLFSGIRDLPWELASWGSEPHQTPLGTAFDLGRMTATQLTHIGSIVHRTIQEAGDPPAVSQRVLMMWDSDIDTLLGQYLEADALGLLEKGIGLDVLAPAIRLNSLNDALAGRTVDLGCDQCTRPKVLARLAQGTYSLIIVALHGEIHNDGRVALAVDDERILEDAFPEISGHPVVLLNSCWSGRAVLDRLLPMVSGLAVQLMSRGAFQVVAPRFPVSARSAAVVTQALLRLGWLHSTARVLRRVRQSATLHPGSLGDLDTFWFLAYGDPTVSKFFELDGVWEFEDAIEKLSQVLPDLSAFADDPAGARKVLALGQGAVLKAMAVAEKWVRTAITRLGTAGGTRATGELAREASGELTGMLAALDDAKMRVEHNYQALSDLLPQHVG